MRTIRLIARVFALTSMFGLSATAFAQSFPSKPIRIVVPFAAGGTSDILARTLQPRLSEALGQPIIIENRTGANGMLGAEAVARAPADGHTLLLTDSAVLTINPSVYPKMTYDTQRDFAPVIMVAYSPHLVAVHPSVKAQTLQELISLAKSNGGRLNFAVSGIGGAPHLAGIDFALRTGVTWTYIPYKGGAQAVTDVAAGQADVLFNGMIATYPQVKSGKLRALGVSSLQRVAADPNIPTIAEASGLAGFESGSWQLLVTAAGTPSDAIQKLNTEFARVLTAPEMKERLLTQGAEVRPDSPERLAAFIKSELARWQKVVKDSGAKFD
jgi:tripartite-type tricarboxylate transporter receptor subunit TctC